MSLFGNSANSYQNKKLLGFFPQTSIYGQVLSPLYGTQKYGGNVLWTGDWKANPVNSGGKFGGKGSSGGKGGGNQQYTYQTAIAIGLGLGIAQQILTIWQDKTVFQVQSAIDSGVIPSGGAPYTVIQPNPYGDLGAAKASTYSVTANDYASPGTVVLAGTQYIPLTYTSSPTPATGQYTINGSGQYVFNSADAGAAFTISYVFTPAAGQLTQGPPLANLDLTFFDGSLGQAPWGYLTTNHGAQAIGYSGISYIANSVMNLDSSGLTPNLSYEIQGSLVFGGGILDCDPTVVFEDFVLNPSYGGGFNSAYLGSLANASAYAVSNGLFCSPKFDTQQDCSQWLQDLATICNAEMVWSGGLLSLVTYGDTTAVGNGATFRPNTQPVYDLDDDDFICKAGEEPVMVEYTSIEDTDNQVSVQWRDRSNGYADSATPEQDDYRVALYGPRPANVLSLPHITTQAVATKVALTQLRQTNKRMQVKFTLGPQYSLLDPMDLLTITDLYLGFDKFPVRVLDIEEQDDLSLQFTCEEFPWGVATPALHPKQTTAGYGPGYYAMPGPVNPPQFFEATNEMTQGTGYELDIALSGGPNWGGCTVWESADGSSYSQVGAFQGPSTMGSLSAALSASVSGNTGSISVNLVESFGTLETVSTSDADQNRTLLAIDNELISYATATLTSSGQYTLTYIKRGVFGTVVSAHAANAPVCSLTGLFYQFQYQSTDVGQTRYFKFTSFNQASQQQQSLADATAYSHIIRTPGNPLAWQPGAQAPISSDPTTQSLNFSTTINYAGPDSNGNYTPNIAIGGYQPVNTGGIAGTPNVSAMVATTSTTGGTFTAGTWIVSLEAYDNTSTTTPGCSLPSPPVQFTFAAGVTTGSVVLTGFTFGPNTQGYRVLVGGGTNESALSSVITALDPGTLPPSITVSGPPAGRTFGPTDTTADHLHLQAFALQHGGPWALQASGPVVAGVLHLPGATVGTGFTANQFQNYPIELLSAASGSPTPIAHGIIASHDTAGNFTLASSTGWTVAAGDVILCGFKLATASANSFSDPNVANAIYPSGNAVNASVGSEAWVLIDNTVQQTQTIASNTTTGWTINGTFDPPITTASRIVIVYPAPVWDEELPLFTATSDATSQPVPVIGTIAGPNQVGTVLLIRAFVEDIDDSVSSELYPVRLVVIAGHSGGAAVVPPVTPVSAALTYDQNGNAIIAATYTPPANASFQGVHVYLEAPDQSGTTTPFVLDSSQLDTTATPVVPRIDLGRFALGTLDGSGNYTVNLPPQTPPNASQTWRVDLCSYGGNYDEPLVPANQAGATPSLTIAVGPAPTNGIGIEYAPLVYGFSVTQIQTQPSQGNYEYRLEVTWSEPSAVTNPTNSTNYSGVSLVFSPVVDLVTGLPVTSGGFTVAVPAGVGFCFTAWMQIPMDQQQWNVRAFSVSSSGLANTYSQGITPERNYFTPLLTPGTPGQGTFLADVTNFAVSVGYGYYAADGSRDLIITPTFTPPADPMWQQIALIGEFPAGSMNFSDVGFFSTGTGSQQGIVFRPDFPTSNQNWNFAAVSIDVNGNPKYDLAGPTFGTSPEVRVAVSPPDTPGSNSGMEYADLIAAPFAQINYSESVDGTAQYDISGTFTPPSDPRYQGLCPTVVFNTGYTVPLGYTSKTDTTFTSSVNPVPAGTSTCVVNFLSVNASGNVNSIQASITPVSTTLTITAPAGNINMGRAAASTLGPGIHVASSALAINPGNGISTLASQIVAAVSGALTTASGSIAITTGNGVTTSGSSLIASVSGVLTTAGGSIALTTGNGITTSGSALVANVGSSGITTSGGQLVANLGSSLGTSGGQIIVNTGFGLTTTGGVVAIASTYVYNGTILCTQLQAGTIGASVTLTAPTLVITAGGFTVNIDATDAVQVSTTTNTCQINGTEIRVYTNSNTAKQAFMVPGEVLAADGIGNTAGIFAVSGSLGLFVNGTRVVTTQQTGPGTLSGTATEAQQISFSNAIVAILQAHGLCS